MLQSSSSSSSSASNCSFMTSISSSSSLNSNKKSSSKTMEEVWKDITVNSLPTTPIHHHIHNIHHPTPNSHFSISRDIILQDFLRNESEARRNNNNNNNNNTSSIESSSSQQHSTIPHTIKPPTTEFQFFDNEMMNSETHQQFPSNNPSAVVHNLIGLNDGVTAFDALANSSVLTSFGGCVNSSNNGSKKRVSEGDDDHGGCVDRRHKRMIKNRESAARSRARKQAYITELELEVNQLKEENEWLRKQQRQLIEAPATVLPKKNGLHRTSTAPF